MTESIFLSVAELALLTGYETPGWQIRWLRKHGIHIYKVNAKRQPVVRRVDVEGQKKAQTVAPNIERVT